MSEPIMSEPTTPEPTVPESAMPELTMPELTTPDPTTSDPTISEPTPKYTTKTLKRVNHLITGVKAFTRQNIGYDFPKGTTLEKEVLRHQTHWEESRKDLEVVKATIRYRTLVRRATGGILPDISKHPRAALGFKFYPSSPNPLEIKDDKGHILAYRFRVPEEFIDTLEESDSLLPVREPGATRRYEAEYGKRKYSDDYQKDLPGADKWREANQPFFKHLSNTLRLIRPEIWVKIKHKVFWKKGGSTPIADAWHGATITQGVTGGGGKARQNWDYQEYVHNVMVPYSKGGWTGGDLILWQLKLKVQVSRGEVLFFLGDALAHELTEVIGERSEVDLFVGKKTFEWKELDDKRRRGGVVLKLEKKTTGKRKGNTTQPEKGERKQKKVKVGEPDCE